MGGASMPKAPAPTIPALVDDPDAPIVFAEELVGGGPSLGNNVNLNFAILLHDHSKEPPAPYRKTVLRVVMPRAALTHAAAFINRIISATPDQTQQPGPKPTLR